MTQSDTELRECPFKIGQVWVNPDDEMMLVTCVVWVIGKPSLVHYTTQDGEKGEFYEDDLSIINNIELLDTRPSPITEEAREALDAINSAMAKTINPAGGQKAIDDYCDRKFCCFAALSTNIETIRKALTAHTGGE